VPPSRLETSVPLDLETICLKCLRKEPEKRYASAAELADELVRYQRGEPITARPVGTLERGSKWVKRNKLVTGAAVAVLLALTAGLAASLWFAYQAGEEAKAARTAEGKADDEAKAAKEAQKREADRAEDLKYQLGVSNIILAGAAFDNRDVRLAAERLDSVPAEQRGWDWHYLKQQVRGGLFTLYGHTGPVTSVAYSTDGTRIVTGGGNQNQPGEVKVWDARTGTLLLDLKGLPGERTGGTYPVTSVSFSPDGTRLLTTGGRQNDQVLARVWDAQSGAPLLQLKGSTSYVNWACFSPDGTRIVTCGAGRDKGGQDYGVATMWDARTGAQLVDMKGARFSVLRVAFSPDGTRLVLRTYDALQVWDAQTGTTLLDVKGNTDGAYASGVPFSPDGARIMMTGRGDFATGAATVFNARTGAVQLELRGRLRPKDSLISGDSGMLSAAFSPDGTRIVTEGGINRDGEATVWDAKTGATLLELNGHTNLVRSVAFSPDGSHIVTGSADGTAKVWDARTGTPRLELAGQPLTLPPPLRGGLSGMALSSDGTRMVTGGSAQSVKVWDAATGKALAELKGFTGGPVAFSPDGTQIATGGYDKKVRLLDARTGIVLLELKEDMGPVMRGVSYSPDGTRIIGSDGSQVKVWDARTGTALLDLKTGSGGGMSFSADGTRIVTAGGTTAQVWDAKTGAALLELKGHDQPVRSVSFSPDGAWIVTGSYDRIVKVWDAATGKAVSERKGVTDVAVSCSPDGRRIVTAGGKTATIWDPANGTVLLELKGRPIGRALFSPDGTRIVSEGLKADDPDKPDEGERNITVWDARTGTALLELKGDTGSITSVAFSPDGTRIAATSAVGERSVGQVNVWDAKTGTALFEVKGFLDSVQGLVFSPDGARFTTGSRNQVQTATVWDARTGTALVQMKGGPGPVTSVAFSADGDRIITAGGEDELPGAATVWDAQTGAPLVELKGLKEGVNSVAFSPDGTQIITAAAKELNIGGDELKVWDARTGTVLRDLTQPRGRGLSFMNHKGGSVAFTPDGTRFVTGGVRTPKSMGDEAKVWDAETGVVLVELKAQRWLMHSLAFSPDGTRIVAGGSDGTARVWNARTGAILLELKGHTGGVNCAAFSPDRDGTRIVTGSRDRTVRVWDARTGTALVELKGHTGGVTSVAFTPDGTRIVSASSEVIVWDARMGTAPVELRQSSYITSAAFSPDSTRIVLVGGAGLPTDAAEVRVFDTRTGAAVLDLQGQTGGVQSMAFSTDGTRIVIRAYNKTVKVWDAQTGEELPGEAIPETVAGGQTSPDGRLFAHLDGNRVELIPLKLDAEEIAYRLLHTRPNPGRYQEGYDAARAANDRFAARFYLDRLLSLPEQRTTERFRERNDLLADPCVIARTGFHHPALAKAPYHRDTIAALAVNGDRFAQRLVAQELLRDGKPGPAIPLLFWCLASRPATSPPVEELLLAQAYLDLKQPDEAKRFYRAATEWLDRPRHPKDSPGGALEPVDDPCHNLLNWEEWHECDVIRAEVEKAMAIR
jgi:WD40 repeat protein